MAVTDIIGDNDTMIHVTSPSSLRIGTNLDTRCYVYSGATLDLAMDADVTIKKWTYVRGNLVLQGLVSVTILDDFYLVVQNFTAQELTVEETGQMVIIGTTTFELDVPTLNFNGNFTSPVLLPLNWHDLSTGPRSIVKFDPDTSSAYLGQNINIRGDFLLGKAISIVHPCNKFVIDGGQLVFNTTDSFTLECANVTINGQFTPDGSVSWGSGVGSLSVGPLGNFYLTADGPITINSLAVAGIMKTYNKVIFESTNATDRRVEVFVVHSPNGQLLLNVNDDFLISNGQPVTSVTSSTIKARYITVNGILDAKYLDVLPGFDVVSVGHSGSFTINPDSDFIADEIYIDGTMISLSPITMTGKTRVNVDNLNIGIAGELHLDSLVQHNKSWTGTSALGIHRVTTSGLFKGGRLRIRVQDTNGWDHLMVENSGVFEFEPEDEFRCNYLEIFGTFESYLPITVRSLPSASRATIFVGTGGSVIFDSLATHPLGPWTNSSHIDAQMLKMETLSEFSCGDTELFIEQADINGTFTADTSSIVLIDRFNISETGIVNFTRPTDVQGISMVTHIGSVLEFDFQRIPVSTVNATKDSNIQMVNVTISGLVRGGSINITADFLIVMSTGQMTVDEGGFSSDAGQGTFCNCILKIKLR